MQSVAAALDIARGSLPPLQQELDIGGGWKRCWDAAAQENYYFHGQSDQAQWENPGNKEARSGECKDQDETTETGAVEWGEQERMEAEQRLRHPPAARTNLPKEGSGAQWARARHAQQEAIPFKAKKAQHLDLRHARLSTHEMIELKVALQTDSTLLNLGLGEASIGDAGATLLADALQHNTTLTALDLEFNRIEPPGAKRLAEALAVNSSLTKLKLEGNHICDAGATHLADALHSNSTLTALDLRWSSLKRDGVAKLAVVLMTNTTLTDLDLGGNEMGEAGVLEMAAALTKNTVLSRLELAGNDRGIDDACATKVVQALASNSTLSIAGLRWRDCGQDRPAQSSELKHDLLAWTLIGKVSFTQDEWNQFRLPNIPINTSIKVGDRNTGYRWFQPTIFQLGLKFNCMALHITADAVVESLRHSSYLSEKSKKSLEAAVATAAVERRMREDELGKRPAKQARKIREFMAVVVEAMMFRLFCRWHIYVVSVNPNTAFGFGLPVINQQRLLPLASQHKRSEEAESAAKKKEEAAAKAAAAAKAKAAVAAAKAAAEEARQRKMEEARKHLEQAAAAKEGRERARRSQPKPPVREKREKHASAEGNALKRRLQVLKELRDKGLISDDVWESKQHEALSVGTPLEYVSGL